MLALGGAPRGARKIACMPFKIGEHAAIALLLQRLRFGLKEIFPAHIGLPCRFAVTGARTAASGSAGAAGITQRHSALSRTGSAMSQRSSKASAHSVATRISPIRSPPPAGADRADMT
jgi:hypothetical protein